MANSKWETKDVLEREDLIEIDEALQKKYDSNNLPPQTTITGKDSPPAGDTYFAFLSFQGHYKNTKKE